MPICPACQRAAKGNIDSDATCDEWSINEKRELKHTLDDTKD